MSKLVCERFRVYFPGPRGFAQRSTGLNGSQRVSTVGARGSQRVSTGRGLNGGSTGGFEVRKPVFEFGWPVSCSERLGRGDFKFRKGNMWVRGVPRISQWGFRTLKRARDAQGGGPPRLTCSTQPC
eukprot:9474502-Pyramimonas_sp.AAC.1